MAFLVTGSDYPKTAITAFAQPKTMTLGQQVAVLTAAHPGLSGFSLFPRGLDGLLLRTKLIRSAQRSLDIQCFAFIEDYSEKLLLNGVLHAADRRVHVRLLIDDLNAFVLGDARKTLGAIDRHGEILTQSRIAPTAHRSLCLLPRESIVCSMAPHVIL